MCCVSARAQRLVVEECLKSVALRTVIRLFVHVTDL